MDRSNIIVAQHRKSPRRWTQNQPSSPSLIDRDELMASGKVVRQCQVAMRHALERMKSAGDATMACYRQWQQSVRQVGELQAQLAVLRNENYKLHFQLKRLAMRRSPSIWVRSLSRLPAFEFFYRAGASIRRRFIIALRNLSAVAAKTNFFADAHKIVQSFRLPSIKTIRQCTEAAADLVDAFPSDPALAADLAYAPGNWDVYENVAPPQRGGLDLILLSPVHRSGSTLLQRLCNARRKTLIWGEHGGLLTQFAGIYANAALFCMAGNDERERYFGQNENPNLWIACMCPELGYVQTAIVDSARAYLDAMYAQYREMHDIVGFKEVQYGRDEVELLRRCYPQAEFILLIRNPLNAWRSTPAEWYLSLDEWIDKWRKNSHDFMELSKSNPRCHLLRHEDVVAREPNTMTLLGEVAKLTPAQIESVLSHKIGGVQGGSIAVDDKEKITERCRDLMETLGYL